MSATEFERFREVARRLRVPCLGCEAEGEFGSMRLLLCAACFQGDELTRLRAWVACAIVLSADAGPCESA